MMDRRYSPFEGADDPDRLGDLVDEAVPFVDEDQPLTSERGLSATTAEERPPAGEPDLDGERSLDGEPDPEGELTPARSGWSDVADEAGDDSLATLYEDTPPPAPAPGGWRRGWTSAEDLLGRLAGGSQLRGMVSGAQLRSIVSHARPSRTVAIGTTRQQILWRDSATILSFVVMAMLLARIVLPAGGLPIGSPTPDPTTVSVGSPHATFILIGVGETPGEVVDPNLGLTRETVIPVITLPPRTPSPKPTPSPTPKPTPVPPSATPGPTDTAPPSPTPTPAVTPTPAATPTPTPAATPTPTPAATPTPTPSPTPPPPRLRHRPRPRRRRPLPRRAPPRPRRHDDRLDLWMSP